MPNSDLSNTNISIYADIAFGPIWKAVKPSAIILHRTSRLHVIPDKPAVASP